ncbi:amidohydrolase family protein [Dactylosporangium sucinum]|uniref:8-oxoguanine deaminase n=1 Tax=Dactylosporangium sucinum TaxID=1424081 RepID=A0A917X6L5_9ACTN|nr:amidohydrolase family protein [Dactylosporangium sucinum]GGM81490.1 8-oxoguanine deaminase [Dactylosporangium sucinum]
MPVTQLLVSSATLIVPSADGCAALPDGWLLVDSAGRIADLGTGATPRAEPSTARLDVAGAFVGPGFVSSHSHLFTSGSRGLGTDQTLYGWAEAMYRTTRHCSPDDIYWCTLHGALDFLGAGVTTAYDFCDTRLRFEPLQQGQRRTGSELRPPEYAFRQADAKADAGLRFVNSVQLDEFVGTEQEVLDRLGDVVRYGQGADPRYYLRTAISGGVQWSADRGTAVLEVAAMRRFNLLNQPHFLETREHLEQQREKFDWYEQAGALGPDLVFGHFVQATPEIVARAAAAGCAMSWQPTANGRLASGVADIPTVRAGGMRVGVGLDDQSCTDLADPWQNMRMGLYMLRAVTGSPTQLSPGQMLRMHTLGSAEVIGVEDVVGSLEVGKYADFVVVDPRSPDVGPVWDPIASYVLACGLRNLRDVYVGGELVSRQGRSTNPLAGRASQELHTRLRALALAATG